MISFQLPRCLNVLTFLVILTSVLATQSSALGQQPSGSRRAVANRIPIPILLRIVRAEDERRWDNDLTNLLSDPAPAVRTRAALAAGRIGDERSVPSLISLLGDRDYSVSLMAVFALGETESAIAGDALANALASFVQPNIRARAVEALGKITAALPPTDEARLRSFRKAIYDVLEFEAKRRSGPDTEVILSGLTAALRARPEGVGKVIAEFLTYSDPRVRSDAANALARLRLKDGNDELRKLLTTDRDPIVRANAARVLGATADKSGFEALVEAASKDEDSRVRVSAVRALAALKDQDPRVAKALAEQRCERLLLKKGKMLYHQRETNCLDLVTALGRVFQGTADKDILARLDHWQWDFVDSPPEFEVAKVRISPGTYLEKVRARYSWRDASSYAQALGEVATFPESTKDKQQLAAQAEGQIRPLLNHLNGDLKVDPESAKQASYTLPDVLRAFAAFKTTDLDAVLIKHLDVQDVVVRSTAAALLADRPPTETNTLALVAALPMALADRDSNDAALAILDALAKQKNREANEALKSALNSGDHLVRRRAIAHLKGNNAGDFSARIGTVKTRNTEADYRRALARLGKRVQATVKTDKGSFTVELLPEEAPLTVDNFVQLAKRGYFRGVSFHRVVPNFVIQGGDPRGDGNGGPGYSIRCEINQVPYERGALGMALSGKDTGGSQWFVTHSPQPHLDGGYTVFGRVVSGMEVVDGITRGDLIRSVVITEGPGRRR